MVHITKEQEKAQNTIVNALLVNDDIEKSTIDKTCKGYCFTYYLESGKIFVCKISKAGVVGIGNILPNKRWK